MIANAVQAEATVVHSGLVVVYVDGVVVGSWRPMRFRRRLVPYDMRTPEWSRWLAQQALKQRGAPVVIPMRIQEG